MTGRNIRTKRIAQIGGGGSSSVTPSGPGWGAVRPSRCQKITCLEGDDLDHLIDTNDDGDGDVPPYYQVGVGLLNCGDCVPPHAPYLQYKGNNSWGSENPWICEEDGSAWSWALSVGEPQADGSNTTSLALSGPSGSVTYRLPRKKAWCSLCSNTMEIVAHCPPFPCLNVPEAVCVKPMLGSPVVICQNFAEELPEVPRVLRTGSGTPLLYVGEDNYLGGKSYTWISPVFYRHDIPLPLRWSVSILCFVIGGIKSNSCQAGLQYQQPSNLNWITWPQPSFDTSISLTPLLITRTMRCCHDYAGPTVWDYCSGGSQPNGAAAPCLNVFTETFSE